MLISRQDTDEQLSYDLIDNTCDTKTVDQNVFFTENLNPFLIRMSAWFSTSSVHHDYYSDLGLDQSANTKSIKEAYYKLSKQYHPDVNVENPDALRKFHVRKTYSFCITV